MKARGNNLYSMIFKVVEFLKYIDFMLYMYERDFNNFRYICMHFLRTHFEMQLGYMCYAVYYAVRVSITKAFIIIIKHLTYYYKT